MYVLDKTLMMMYSLRLLYYYHHGAVAAEQALQKRASMTYSKDTVADVAKATKVASKRLRTALVAAQWAQNANRFLGP
jgi:hypothetical protein